MKIAMSSGHGKYIRGASGYLDEVDEARRVVAQTASVLHSIGVECATFNDDVSRNQSENLKRIVDWHNGQQRDLDVSVHFNAYKTTAQPMGTEVCYLTRQDLAANLAIAIANAGNLIDRGPKQRTGLYFLKNTQKPAVLIEVCFVDSSVDARLYQDNCSPICSAIADVIADWAPRLENKVGV